MLAVALLLAAGCAGDRVAAPPGDGQAPAGDGAPAEEPLLPPPTGDPALAMAADDLRIECDRVRVVVPERLRDRTAASAGGARPYRVTVGSLRLEPRETPPELSIGGESFSVIAEGTVLFHRVRNDHDRVEGPYKTVVIRDGRVLLR